MAAAQQVEEMTTADYELESTQNTIHAARVDVRMLTRRFIQLEQIPGGRQHMTPQQRIEYDLIGAFLIDARASISDAYLAKSRRA